MREIKFRAWDGDSESMALPDECAEQSLSDMDGWGWELMQYTGLKDKNGKEIYEGDLIDLGSPSAPISVIEWDEKTAGFVAVYGPEDCDRSDQLFGADLFTVTGNIYEAPELLEQP